MPGRSIFVAFSLIFAHFVPPLATHTVGAAARIVLAPGAENLPQSRRTSSPFGSCIPWPSARYDALAVVGGGRSELAEEALIGGVYRGVAGAACTSLNPTLTRNLTPLARRLEMKKSLDEGLRRVGVVLGVGLFVVGFHQPHVIAPQVRQVPQYALGVLGVKRDAVDDMVAQLQSAVAGEIHVDDLDVGVATGDVIEPRERAAYLQIASLVMDRGYDEFVLVRVVDQMEQAKVADDSGAEELGNKAFVTIVGPCVLQHAMGIAAAGDFSEPAPVLLGRVDADAFDVAHHREAERVWIDAGVVLLAEPRLLYDIGVGVQEFHEGAVVDQARFVQPGHDAVVHEGGATFVHQLGLLRRIEVLRDQTDDANDFPLPRPESRRRLLQKIEEVLLRQAQERPPAIVRRVSVGAPARARHGAPEVVEQALAVLAPLLLAALLRTQVRFAHAGISVNPVAHQRVGRIEHALHLAHAVVVLAFGNVALGEGEIIQDPVRVGPLPEDVVVLEEMVVAEGRVGEHGRL